MNFILMLKGYPPAIIKTEDKESYYAALQQADAGDISYFFNYVCEQIIRSLELMIKGAKGEDVEEENDLDKKLALLKQEIEAEDSENEIKLELNGNTIYEIINNWVFELFDVLENTSKKFDQFYQKNSAYVMNNIDSQSINVYLKDFLLNNSNNSLNLLLRENKSHNNAKITYRRFFETYIKGGINPFSCNYSIEIIFDKLTYKIDIGYFDIKMNALNKMTIISKRLLSKNISKLDMIKINSLWGDSLLNHLAYYRSLLKK